MSRKNPKCHKLIWVQFARFARITFSKPLLDFSIWVSLTVWHYHLVGLRRDCGFLSGHFCVSWPSAVRLALTTGTSKALVTTYFHFSDCLLTCPIWKWAAAGRRKHTKWDYMRWKMVFISQDNKESMCHIGGLYTILVSTAKKTFFGSLLNF